MADLHCGNQKACKLLSELENKTGLIKRKRQGLGKPSLIYVLKFSTSCPQNDSESHFKTCENHTSGDVKTTSLDMWKSHGNNTDFNKPEYNKTNPIYAERSDHTPWQASCFLQRQSMRTSMAKGFGQRFLRMATQLLPSRIWPVRAKTARISGRMRKRPSATAS